MRHLLSAWEDVAFILKAAEHILLLSDFDGTLAPLAQKPKDVHLPKRTRHHLATLARTPSYTVGVISGRALREVEGMVNIADIFYAGNHGLEIKGPGLSFVHPEAQKLAPALDEANRELQKALWDIPGILVQNKGLSLSVHYRRVQVEKVGRVREVVHHVLGMPHFSSVLRLTEGKKIYEVRPSVEWDKGKAVDVLLDHCITSKGIKTVLPIFLGDDSTDEDGFRTVGMRDGISVVIDEEERETTANYSLRSLREVQQWLGLLVGDTMR